MKVKTRTWLGWLTLLFLCTLGANTEAAEVPHLLHYQSTLSDDGGKPIADGPIDITFRVKNSTGDILYSERQTIDVISGQIAAIIGNGLDPASSAPTGGLPSAVFVPGDGRYLEVEVMGYPPSAPMEIVAVPYAFHAERAEGVADGAVGSAAIAAGSVTLKHFAPETVKELAQALTADDLLGAVVTKGTLDQNLHAPTGAAGIGVASGFVYSAKGDVQGVLRDLDRAIDMRQTKIDEEARLRTAAVTAEATARSAADVAEAQLRTTADATLSSRVDSETSARSSADTVLQTAITTEANTRQTIENNFTTTVSDINNIPGILSAGKIDDAITRDSELQANVDAINNRLTTLEGLPRIYAWGRVRGGSPPSLIAGYNVASVTWDGEMVITFTNPLPSANYAITLTPFSSNFADSSTTGFIGFVITQVTANGFHVATGMPQALFSFTVVD